MDTEVISIIKAALTTSPLLGVAFIMWKSGLLTALAKKIEGKQKPNGEVDDRMSALEAFRLKAETNHFHDLTNVMEDIKEIKGHMHEIRNEHKDTRERLIRVEVKVNGNGYGKH